MTALSLESVSALADAIALALPLSVEVEEPPWAAGSPATLTTTLPGSLLLAALAREAALRLLCDDGPAYMQ